MALVEGLARWLGNNVVGLDYSLTGGGNVFEEDTPSEPDIAVTVRPYGGPEGALGMPSNEQRVQVVFRGESGNPFPALDRWRAAYAAVHGLRRVVLPDGTEISWALVMQAAPVSIGADENGRMEYVMNVRAEVIGG